LASVTPALCLGVAPDRAAYSYDLIGESTMSSAACSTRVYFHHPALPVKNVTPFPPTGGWPTFWPPTNLGCPILPRHHRGRVGDREPRSAVPIFTMMSPSPIPNSPF